MTLARSMSSFARRVTSPGSPGPAPTKKMRPVSDVCLAFIDFLEQLSSQVFRGTGRAGNHRFGWLCAFVRKKLYPHFQGRSVDLGEHANWAIAVRLQEAKKLAFRTQAKMRRRVVCSDND